MLANSNIDLGEWGVSSAPNLTAKIAGLDKHFFNVFLSFTVSHPAKLVSLLLLSVGRSM